MLIYADTGSHEQFEEKAFYADVGSHTARTRKQEAESIKAGGWGRERRKEAEMGGGQGMGGVPGEGREAAGERGAEEATKQLLRPCLNYPKAP